MTRKAVAQKEEDFQGVANQYAHGRIESMREDLKQGKALRITGNWFNYQSTKNVLLCPYASTVRALILPVMSKNILLTWMQKEFNIGGYKHESDYLSRTSRRINPRGRHD